MVGSLQQIVGKINQEADYGYSGSTRSWKC